MPHEIGIRLSHDVLVAISLNHQAVAVEPQLHVGAVQLHVPERALLLLDHRALALVQEMDPPDGWIDDQNLFDPDLGIEVDLLPRLITRGSDLHHQRGRALDPTVTEDVRGAERQVRHAVVVVAAWAEDTDLSGAL